MADEITENQVPSIDPAELDTIMGAFQFIFKKKLQGIDDMLPATVIAYDREKNLAQVQPMVRLLSTGGQLLTRAPIASVPVLALGGGGFVINFPLAAGDTGWIKANDRDISLYLQSSYAESAPNTTRLHSFSDGLFIPDIMNKYTIDGEDDDNMVIQNLDATVKVTLSSDKVKLFADYIDLIANETVDIEAKNITMTADEKISLTATDIESSGSWAHTGTMDIDGDTTITGDVDITGDTTMTGNLDITGDVTIIGTITVNGVDIGELHQHSGVVSGFQNSGPVVP